MTTKTPATGPRLARRAFLTMTATGTAGLLAACTGGSALVTYDLVAGATAPLARRSNRTVLISVPEAIQTYDTDRIVAREAGGVGSWVSLLAFVPLWFSGVLMSAPDGLLSRVLSFLPLTSSSGILARLSAGGEMPGWQIGLSLGGVVVLSAIVLWVATRVFRAAILMRGQSFTGRNLWAALRNAG